MSALFAFLHHLAAFALVASLAVEFVVIRDDMNARTARRLGVFYFEKGAAFYFSSGAFIAKLASSSAWF